MNRLTYIGIAIAIILVIVAVFAPFIATQDVTLQDTANRYAAISAQHWFGTDDLGRDVFSRLVYGSRVSLIVGITVTTVSAIIGMIIGQ